MPFLSKLSKRLAKIRLCTLASFAAAALYACDPRDPSLNTPPNPSYSTSTGLPADVSDLAVTAVSDTSVTLSFTEVDDGMGGSASYDMRAAVAPISWGSAAGVTRGSCAGPIVGSVIGAKRTCTVLELEPGTAYDFQVVPFVGTLRVDAVFGSLSNVASGQRVCGAGGGVGVVR